MCITTTTSRKKCVHCTLAHSQPYSDYRMAIAENSRLKKIKKKKYMSLNCPFQCSEFSLLTFSYLFLLFIKVFIKYLKRYLRGWKDSSAVENSLLNHEDWSLNLSPHVGWLTNAFTYRSKDSNTLLQPLQILGHTHIKISKS